MANKIGKGLVATLLLLLGATGTAAKMGGINFHNIVNWFNNNKTEVCIFCTSPNPDQTANNKVRTYENSNYLVTLDDNGQYSGLDKIKGDRMHLLPQVSGKSWRNRDYQYTIIQETKSILIVRVTFPSGISKDETLYRSKS
jgi:hypothetical protein